MNKLFLGLSILILLNSCKTLNSKEQRLRIKIDQIEKIPSSVLNLKSGDFYSVKINLINNTDSTIRFWMMSTSWWDNWIFNSDGICFYWLTCNHNFPSIKELLPHKNLTLNSIIEVCDTSNNKIKQGLKLGFILINKNEYSFEKDYFEILLDKKNKHKDIIWCDEPIILKK